MRINPVILSGGCGARLWPLSLANEGVACAVTGFVKKPDQATARYLAEGGYTWNSGMFVFTASRYLEELQAHGPAILAAATQAWQDRTQDLDFIRPDSAAFLACPSDSIDYALMQKIRRAAVLQAAFDWSNVGSWDSLWQISAKDPEGNALQGDVFAALTRNSYIRAESRLRTATADHAEFF